MHITNSIKVRKELQFALLSPNLSIFEDTEFSESSSLIISDLNLKSRILRGEVFLSR